MEECKNPEEKKGFFKKLGEKIKANKGKTVAITLVAFVLICAIVSLCCLSAFVFNRFATGVLPTDADLDAVRGQYKRVVIIGVDGTGAYPGEMLDDDEGSLPNFKKLFVDGTTTKNGTKLYSSVTYEGVAVYPTISAQNWTSMFRGVRPPYHGITGNNSNKELDKGKQPNEKYPSFVKVVLDAHENAKAFSSCTWSAVNNGAIEDHDRLTKMNTTCKSITDILSEKSFKIVLSPDEFLTQLTFNTYADGVADPDYSLRDAITVQRVIDAATSPEGEDYEIFYMHLNQVDSAGHSYGYNKQAYARAVSRVDNLIGRLYNAFDEAGMADDALFIFCTDHGHRYLQDGTGHGGNSDVEVKVTFAVAGKTVKQGTPGKYVNTDLAPIVTYALGVKAPDVWQGLVPYDMFTALN